MEEGFIARDDPTLTPLISTSRIKEPRRDFYTFKIRDIFLKVILTYRRYVSTVLIQFPAH